MRLRRLSALILTLPLFLFGCGPKMIDARGQLTIDGAPVSGAMLTFVSTAEGSNANYTAMSDDSGNFTVVNGDTRGVLAGTYKVTVVKSPKGSATEMTAIGDPDYLKDMKSNTDKQKGAGNPMNQMMGKKGGMGPMGPMGGAPAGPTIKSELPLIYATFNTTTFSVTVPGEAMPLKFDMKGDAKKK